MLGYIINERYQLQETLGEGGFGVVYRALDLHLKREVAIKILHINAQKDPQQAERFMAEARITSNLSHPHLLTLYDSGQITQLDMPNEHVIVGQLFIVSELLKGVSLEQLLERKVLTLPQMMWVLSQVSEALAVAHDAQVIHRDIKPPNLFIHRQKGGEVIKLLDFGIAKVADERSHTLTGQLFGTPYYMSPEQIYGQKSLTHATDVYSLGVLTFHCLSGRVPFDGDSQYMIFHKHINEPVPPLSKNFPPLMDPDLQGFVERMMAKRPEERFQDANAVLEALGELKARHEAWFVTPAPLLEGLEPRRSDTSRQRVSELKTSALEAHTYDLALDLLSEAEEEEARFDEEQDTIPPLDDEDAQGIEALMVDEGHSGLLSHAQLTADTLHVPALDPPSDTPVEPSYEVEEPPTDPLLGRQVLRALSVPSTPPPSAPSAPPPFVPPLSAPLSASPSSATRPPPLPRAPAPALSVPPVLGGLLPTQSHAPVEPDTVITSALQDPLEERTRDSFLRETEGHTSPNAPTKSARSPAMLLFVLSLVVVIGALALSPQAPSQASSQALSEVSDEGLQVKGGAHSEADLGALAPPQAGSLLPELIPLPQLEGEDVSEPQQDTEPAQREALKRPEMKQRPRVRSRKSVRSKRPSSQKRAPQKRTPQKRTRGVTQKSPSKGSKKRPEVKEVPLVTRVVLKVLGKPLSGQPLNVKVYPYDETGQIMPFEARFEAYNPQTKATERFSSAPLKLSTGTWRLKACVEGVCSATRELFVRSSPL